MDKVERFLPDGLVELLEWRGHGSHDLIAYTEFGPYMVDGAYFGKPRAWLPDGEQQCRIMCEGFSSVEAAKSFSQQELDGRRALSMVKACGEFLMQGETPSQRIQRERKDVGVIIEMLAIERSRTEALRELVEAFEAYEPVDAALSKARAALARTTAEGRS